MIIYNVTIKTDADITKSWLQWMKEEHLPEMMETGLFTEYRLCQLLDQEDSDDSATFVIQFHCQNKVDYQKYIDQHAQEMRERGYQKFGNKFAGFRTIMKVLN